MLEILQPKNGKKKLNKKIYLLIKRLESRKKFFIALIVIKIIKFIKIILTLSNIIHEC